jgi:integrase
LAILCKTFKLEAKTEAQAKKERDKIWMGRKEETWAEPKDFTVNECYARWISHLKNRPKPAGRRTIEEYEKIYKNHIIDTLGQRKYIIVNNALVELAYKDGDIGLKENVCKRLDPPKIEETEHFIWNVEQCKAFLNAARNSREYGVFLMAMTAGMRIGEVLGIRWRDIDLKNKKFSIIQKLEKKETGNPGFRQASQKQRPPKLLYL